MKQSAVDVLIVGGGPTGLALALELAAQGTPPPTTTSSPSPSPSFRIIDRARGRSDKSRALVVQPRTLELLHRHGLGLARALQARGNTAAGSTTVVAGRAVAGFETAEVAGLPNTAFPLQCLVSQQDTEEVLDAALADRYGVQVEWGTEARGIVQDAEGVSVTLGRVGGEAKEGGEEEEEETVVRAKFVVGCDGKNSSVRAAAGIKFEGDSYAQDFVLADARIRWNSPEQQQKSNDNINRAYLCFGHGFFTLLPLGKDMFRVVAVRSSVTSTDQKGGGGSDGKGAPTLAEFQSAFDREMPPELGGTLRDPTWLARFYLHHRGADRYSAGRLFVAGDAAHVHSPVGGQGMNTGIQDAVNLGWKLAAVLRGERPPSLLEATYHAERHPVGRELLRTTDRAFSWMSWMHPVFLFLRNLVLPWVLPLAFRNKERVRANFWNMSQFLISYRGCDSGIVGTASSGLDRGVKIRGGDRVFDGRIRSLAAAGGDEEGEKYLLELLDARTHHLLLFSGVGSEAASEGDLLRAEAKFAENNRIATKVHTIYAQKPNGQSGYVDVDGILHREIGFKKASYILVRPDSYAAHVGPLSALDDLITWFNDPTK